MQTSIVNCKLKYEDLVKSSENIFYIWKDIPEGDIFKVIEIDSLITFGEDVRELLSMTFVNKVLNLLKSGNKIIDVEI